MGNTNKKRTKDDVKNKKRTKDDVITPDYKTYVGGGSFGHVYKGTYGGQEVAVKTINKHTLKNKYQNIDQNEIIPFLKGLNHHNVISILAWEDHDYELRVALDLCDTSLDKYVKDTDISDLLTCDVLRQGATGLAYLHSNNIVHRDLRPDNLLILMKNSHPIIKITDFSLCKDIDEQTSSSMITVWGNPNWLAPELLTEDGHSATDVRYKRSIDVFSYALIMLYVCVNAAGRKMINKINCGLVVKHGEDVLARFEEHWRSPGLKERFLPSLKRLLALDKNARPTVKEILCDKVFPPPVVPTPPRLRSLASHSLGYEAFYSVGVGADNHVLVGRKDTNTLQLLQVRNGAYKVVWDKPCPRGVRVGDAKSIVGRIITTRDYGCDPTRCFDLEMERLHEHHVGERMRLVSCLPPHVLVYRKMIENDSFKLVLHGGDVPQLSPPTGSQWDDDLSVCQHPGSGWYAVCEFSTRSLDVFNETGRHQLHVTLSYMPDYFDAIVSTESHIIIHGARSSVLHIHMWCGEEVARIDVGPILAINAQEFVWSVGACDRGRTLHVAVGSMVRSTVCSLHSLHVEQPEGFDPRL